MRAMRIGLDKKQFLAINNRLGDAAIDPTIWPELLDLISKSVGSAGAALLQSDKRTADIPRSAGADEVISNYFANGWHTRDIRAERGVPLLLRGQKIVTDQDIVTPEEMRKHGFYTENLAPFGFQWFAAIGFWSGSALWALAIQRTTREGPFVDEDKRALAQLSRRLTEIATLSKAVGQTVLTGVANALDQMQQPVIALDRLGAVVEFNAHANQLFDDEIRINKRRLYVRDSRAQCEIDVLIDQMRASLDTDPLSSSPIVVRRRESGPIIIHVLPVDGAVRSPFLGARVLLIPRDLSKTRPPKGDLLKRAFGLSPAEMRLAIRLATGISLEAAADHLGIARETARTQLKAIFTKTGTHRQAELVALLLHM